MVRGKCRAHGGAAACDSLVVVKSVILSPEIHGNVVSNMEVHISRRPNYIRGVNVTNAMLDHTLKEPEGKKIREAETVSGPKF